MSLIKSLMGLEILDLENHQRHSVIPMVVRAKFTVCHTNLRAGLNFWLEFLGAYW